MAPVDKLVIWLFVTVNAGRALAYMPQIWSAACCRNGAIAVSLLTWGYFAVAHLSGALYSLHIAHDMKLAGVFFGNFVACAALLAVVAVRRYQRARIGAVPSSA